MKNSHNAGTFNPYDPSETIGDIGPAPKPATNKNKCGVFGQVIIAAVAVAVTIATSGAFSAALGPVLGAMATGATASIASQVVGVATGIQDKFSWKSVAISALSAGMGGGRGGNIFLDAVGAAVNNAAVQGVSILVGLQDKFDWAGVAAAGVGSLARGAVGAVAGRAAGSIGSGALRDAFRTGLPATADAITSAAARSLLTGTSFGDNVAAVLPGVIARTIGDVVSGEIERAGIRREVARQQRQDGTESIQVTAFAGGDNAILPSGLANDPQLRALADAVPGNLSQLRADFEEARNRTNRALQAEDRIRQDIRTAQTQLSSATAANQRAQLEASIASLQHDLSRASARAAQLLNRETQLENTFVNSQAKLTDLQNYLVGKSIIVRQGGVATSYTIRGPNPSEAYSSRDAAAIDALALSWAVVRATGRNIEYAGYIYEDSPGAFTYNQTMRIGRGAQARDLPIALSAGMAASANFISQNPLRREVGIFHIHPRSNDSDDDANKFFGPGDLYASQTLSNREGRSLAHYLGASDGAVRLLPDPRDPSLPIAPVYVASNFGTHVTPPKSAYQLLRPPGYFR